METKSNNVLRRTQILVCIFCLSSIVLWLIQAQLPQINAAFVLPIHTGLETATVVLFASVFIVCWNAYGDGRKRNSIILAVAFLCTAILGFLHAISFQGMPGFPDAVDMHKSYCFWLASRGIISLTFLGLAIQKYDAPISKTASYSLLAIGLIGTLAYSLLVFNVPSFFPTMYIQDQGQSTFKIFAELVLILINVFTGFIFYRNARGVQSVVRNLHLQIKARHLFFASILMALSEAFFSFYINTDHSFVAIGHSLQLLAAIAIYRGMVAINIQAPYSSLVESSAQLSRSAIELDIHKQRLSGMIATAMDGIITIDDKQNIVLVNPAAAAIFGYQVNQLIGTSLNLLIPMRHHQTHGKHVREFGETGNTRRRMGNIFEDYYVSGLHAKGHEFPLEASISSLDENGKRFYTVIFRDISDRKIAKEKMAQYHDQLSQLSAALQSIREEERKHIARELHDDLGQLLAALRMDLSLLQREENLSAKSQKTLSSMDHLLLTSITTLRRIATDLRPRALDEGGLYFALQTLQKDFSNRHGIDCLLEAHEEQLILDDERSTAIFRIIQESLTNVVRHATASEVHIQFERHNNQLKLNIADNGKGIAEDEMNKTHSFGLVGMRERIKALHGTFKIHSDVGQGTQLQITIPLENTTI
jgi:PAS domain S-box-containing protein